MGKNQKIPYLNEVLLYFVKVAVIFFVLSYLLSKTEFYNQSLLLIFSIFVAFSFNPIFIILVGLDYIISFWIINLQIGDFGLLILYLFSVLLNTFFMIVYLRIKYRFKEE